MSFQDALTLLGETQDGIEFMPLEFWEYLASSTLQMALRMQVASKSPTVTTVGRTKAGAIAKRAIPLIKAYQTVRNHRRQQ